jgi:hypothetical protein
MGISAIMALHARADHKPRLALTTLVVIFAGGLTIPGELEAFRGLRLSTTNAADLLPGCSSQRTGDGRT